MTTRKQAKEIERILKENNIVYKGIRYSKNNYDSSSKGIIKYDIIDSTGVKYELYLTPEFTIQVQHKIK